MLDVSSAAIRWSRCWEMRWSPKPWKLDLPSRYFSDGMEETYTGDDTVKKITRCSIILYCLLLFAEFSALKELLLEGRTPSCNVFLVSSSTWRFSPECGGGGVRPPPEPPGAGHVRPPSSPLQISHGLYNPYKRIPSLWTNAPGCDRLSSRKPGASRYDMSSPRRPSDTAEGTLRIGCGRLSIARDL